MNKGSGGVITKLIPSNLCLQRTAIVINALILLARSTLGPTGRHKLVHLNPTSLYFSVTSTSSEIFSQLPVQHHVARVLLQVVLQHRNAVGDGGWALLFVLASTIETALPRALTFSYPLHLIAYGLSLASTWIEELLTPNSRMLMSSSSTDNKEVQSSSLLSSPRFPICQLQWSSSAPILTLLCSVMGTKTVAFPFSRTQTRSRPHQTHMLLQRYADPEQLSPLDYLALLLLQAFLYTLPVTQSRPGQPRSSALTNLRLLPLIGRSSDTSELFKGVVIERALPGGWPRRLGRVRVLLFNISLTATTKEQFSEELAIDVGSASSGPTQPHGDTGDTTSIDSPGSVAGSWTRREVQWRMLRAAADKWLALGVQLLASQKLIHPYLKYYLGKHGVLCLERLSARHIRAVQCVTGSVVHSVLDPFSACSQAELAAARAQLSPHSPAPARAALAGLGCLESIEQRSLAGKNYLFFSPVTEETKSAWSMRQQPLCTLLLWSLDEPSVEELERCVRTGISTLTHLLRSPFVVPGGGCTETLLAHQLRQRFSRLPRPKGSTGGSATEVSEARLYRVVGKVVRDVATALETLASAVTGDEGDIGDNNSEGLDNDEERILLLRQCNRLDGSAASLPPSSDPLDSAFFGWVRGYTHPQEVFRMTSTGALRDARVLDSLYLKRSVIQTALETAGTILRIDSILNNSPK